MIPYERVLLSYRPVSRFDAQGEPGARMLRVIDKRIIGSDKSYSPAVKV